MVANTFLILLLYLVVMKLLWEILVGKIGQIRIGFVPEPALTHSMEKEPLLYVSCHNICNLYCNEILLMGNYDQGT